MIFEEAVANRKNEMRQPLCINTRLHKCVV